MPKHIPQFAPLPKAAGSDAVTDTTSFTFSIPAGWSGVVLLAPGGSGLDVTVKESKASGLKPGGGGGDGDSDLKPGGGGGDGDSDLKPGGGGPGGSARRK